MRKSRRLPHLSQPPPPVSAGSCDVPRLALPNDLSTSLRFLGETDLERLRMAVAAEINRRNRLASPGHADDEPASTPIPVREKRSTSEELPEGKVNLIRASLNAGVKPATIARTFHDRRLRFNA
jgi:hypothetical protein